MPIGATRVWTIGEVLSASNLNIFVSDVADDNSGRNGVTEQEDSLAVLSGIMGNRFIGLPGGLTGQRPLNAGVPLIRWNETDSVIDLADALGVYSQVLSAEAVTYANLDINGDIGLGANMVADGQHTHPISLIDSYASDITANGDLYIAGLTTDRVYRYSFANSTWDSGIPVPAAETSPTGVAVAANGDLYITAVTTDRVYRYSFANSMWDSGIPVPAAETNPSGVAVAYTPQALAVFNDTVSAKGLLHIEVSTTTLASPAQQAAIAVTIGGNVITPTTEVESDNGLMRFRSYRAAVNIGDAYDVSVDAQAGGAIAAFAFLNQGAAE